MSPADPQPKLRVLFVATTTRAQDGGTGGLITQAAHYYNSPLREHVEFLEVHTSMLQVVHVSQLRRLSLAFQRIVSFLRLLPSADVAWIFGADGLSIVEKG